MAWVFSDCFFTYTVSIITSVRSFFLSQVQAAGGVYVVYDLHQLVGVALVVLLEGDGGQLAKSVVGGHHHLLPRPQPLSSPPCGAATRCYSPVAGRCILAMTGLVSR